MAQNLETVDWSKIPAPADDGAGAHLTGMALPSVQLTATDGASIDLAKLDGLGVIYAYPMTGRPDVALPDGWDSIPGARGCTPQSCAFRDHMAELKEEGVNWVYGLSTQETEYQAEAKARLHLPFELLSDARLALASVMRLPLMEVEGSVLLKRLALVVEDNAIKKAFYPVFPPDRNVVDVLDYLRQR